MSIEENKENDFPIGTQEIFIHILLNDADTYTRCMNIIKPSYFDAPLRKLVKFIQEYAEKYKAMPPYQLINSSVNYNINENFISKEEVIGLVNSGWFFTEFEKFCRDRAVQEAVYKVYQNYEKGSFDNADKILKDALLISLDKDLGIRYFENPKARLEKLRDRTNIQSTGFKDLDMSLYGGFGKGELAVIAALSGQGKSLFLQNLALNWIIQKLNVVYITFELSEELVAQRIDAMLTGYNTKDIKNNLESVHIFLKNKEPHYGDLRIKYLPVQSSTNDIAAYLKELQIQTNKKYDVLIVDYLDLMMPNNKKVDISNVFLKDKLASEELRGLAVELNMVCASASQLNRGAVNEDFHDMDDIAGGISKINTADNVMSLYANKAMKERGEYRLSFIKTRNSAGVGSSILLGYDINSMRMSDYTGDNDEEIITDSALTQAEKARKELLKSVKTPPVPTNTIKTSSKSSINNNNMEQTPSPNVLSILNKIKEK